MGPSFSLYRQGSRQQARQASVRSVLGSDLTSDRRVAPAALALPSSTSATTPTMTRPSHHLNDTKSSFTNPWPSAVFPSLTELCWSGGFPLGWARKHLHRHPKAESIKVVKPDWGSSYLSSHPKLEERKALRGTWLGHAGAFVEVPLNGLEKEKGTAKLLFDPIFSGRAGPTSYTGPGRIRESPCMVEDLPGVDCVFISHNQLSSCAR